MAKKYNDMKHIPVRHTQSNSKWWLVVVYTAIGMLAGIGLINGIMYIIGVA